jgi:hypothetical protein
METVLANSFMKEVLDEETSITFPNVDKTYLNNLGEMEVSRGKEWSSKGADRCPLTAGHKRSMRKTSQ